MKGRIEIEVDEWFKSKNKPYLEFRNRDDIYRVSLNEFNGLKIELVGGIIR